MPKGWKGLGSPDRTIFATFCMSDETEKVCQELEEVINS
jgi:hypothetical protein